MSSSRMSRGFTLVEVLVVVSILIILITISLSSFFSLRRTKALEQNTEQTASFIKEAQTSTLASLNASTYGVTLYSTHIDMFASTSSNVIKTLTFTDLVSLTSLGGASTISFERFTGEASASSTFALSHASQTGTSTFILSETGTLTINRTQ